MPNDDPTQTSPPVSNQTPSAAPPVTPTEPKMVPESDLITVKKGAERKEAELLSQIAESNRLKDETHNLYLQEQAAREQLEEQAKEGATNKEQVVELTAKIAAAEESRKQLEEELLGIKRTYLATAYGVSEESLKDKDAGQLKNLEDALKLVGTKGKPANFDKGPGGTTPAAPTTILEQCKVEIAQARELAKRKAEGDTDYKP